MGGGALGQLSMILTLHEEPNGTPKSHSVLLSLFVNLVNLVLSPRFSHIQLCNHRTCLLPGEPHKGPAEQLPSQEFLWCLAFT